MTVSHRNRNHRLCLPSQRLKGTDSWRHCLALHHSQIRSPLIRVGVRAIAKTVPHIMDTDMGVGITGITTPMGASLAATTEAVSRSIHNTRKRTGNFSNLLEMTREKCGIGFSSAVYIIDKSPPNFHNIQALRLPTERLATFLTRDIWEQF